MLDTQRTYTTRYGDKTVEAASMFDINKTIMRCLTKNLAMFGLGHYIYAGEDLPETQPEPVEMQTLKVGDDNWKNILKFIAENKDKGLTEISSMVKRKYKVTATIQKALKAEIEKS